jgi:hypothetical protein
MIRAGRVSRQPGPTDHLLVRIIRQQILKRQPFTSTQPFARQCQRQSTKGIASQLESDGQRETASVWRSRGENPQAMFAQAWLEATALEARYEEKG